MSTPAAVREALAAYITANVTGLRALTDPGSIANPPVAVVLPPQGTYINYTVALDQGVWDPMIRVVIIVSRASERVATPLLESYLAPYGASSIPAAILADPTLGGACDYCVPVESVFLGEVNWAGVDYFGAEIICQAGAR
jgi:hypothetical protein